MRNSLAPKEPGSPPRGVTRRTVLGFLSAVAAGPLLATKAIAAQVPWRAEAQTLGSSDSTGLPRFRHASVALGDGRVVVIGGYATSDATRSRAAGAPTSSVQIYNPGSGSWTDLAPTNIPRARHAAVLLPDGRIAVLGGYFTSPLNSIEVYDPRRNRWQFVDSLPSPMVDHTATVCGDLIVVTGGLDGVPAIAIPVPSDGLKTRP